MDILKFAASGGYREPRGMDTRRWGSQRAGMPPTRKPVPGSRTQARLRRRHYTQGLVGDKPKPVTPVQRAAMLAMVNAPKPTPTRRPPRLPTAADLPVLPDDASHAEITAWQAEYDRLAHARRRVLREATMDPYKSRMGEGPDVKLRFTANGPEVTNA